jgi:peptide/nickel transport system permease protein
MFGVLLLTFLLFRVAAGDPAAAVLGKNPSAEELELMRNRLGTSKPLLFGTERPTLCYNGGEFVGAKPLPKGATACGGISCTEKGLVFSPGSSLKIPREFVLNAPVKSYVETDGETNQKIIHFIDNQGNATIKNESSFPVTVRKISFTVPTDGIFDTQFFDAFRELISFEKTFPYIRFFQFGETLLTREPIKEVLFRGMGASLCLMIPVFLGELIVGIVLAMLSAVFRGSWVDRFLMLLSVAGMSISYLALIIACQWFFGYWLNWFPVWGWGEPKHLFLPVLVGIISGTGGGVRFYRTVFLNEMNKEYLRTAIAKGCGPTVVYFRHLLRNAAIPIMTRASAILPFLFTGSLLLESFFGIPGLGYKGVDALNSSDLQMLKALVILGSFLFVFINLIADILYAWADPRVRPE